MRGSYVAPALALAVTLTGRFCDTVRQTVYVTDKDLTDMRGSSSPSPSNDSHWEIL